MIMTERKQRDIGWIWTSGATILLLAVGGLIYQVKTLSEHVEEIRLHGSPVLKARLDVIESVATAQQRQMDVLTLDVKVELKEIKRLLEEHMKAERPK